MLKRCLRAAVVAFALVLSAGVHQVYAECSLVVHTVCTPAGCHEVSESFSC